MPTLLDRYQNGEQIAVWEEIHSDPAIPGAAAVAQETVERAWRNLERLVNALQGIGYAFTIHSQPEGTHRALELRITRALEYVSSTGGKAYRKDPWSHPALAWVKEEGALPIEYAKQLPARNVLRAAKPDAEARIHLHEAASGPLPLLLHAWYQRFHSVDLRGTHPILAPAGERDALFIPSITESSPPITGPVFLSRLRRAFAWGGLPGWEAEANVPNRELDFLRKGLEPL